MTLDEKGNLYLTGEGVVVYSPEGKKIAEIAVPERPANVCFGGADNKTLFITARTGFYAVKMSVAGQ
jgi:gluconolactonase